MNFALNWIVGFLVFFALVAGVILGGWAAIWVGTAYHPVAGLLVVGGVLSAFAAFKFAMDESR